MGGKAPKVEKPAPMPKAAMAGGKGKPTMGGKGKGGKGC
jgi:hypothetical protein